MKIRFSQTVAVFALGLLFAGWSLSGAPVPEKSFLDEVAAMQNLREKNLVPVQMKKEFVFVPGTPADGWQNKAADGKKSVFKGKLDLDTLTGKKNELGTESVPGHGPQPNGGLSFVTVHHGHKEVHSCLWNSGK